MSCADLSILLHLSLPRFGYVQLWRLVSLPFWCYLAGTGLECNGSCKAASDSAGAVTTKVGRNTRFVSKKCPTSLQGQHHESIIRYADNSTV